MRYDTIQQAAEAWVREFDAYPQWMIEKLAGDGFENLYEITPISKYDRVYCFNENKSGEVVGSYGEDMVVVKLDNGKTKRIPRDELEVQRDYILPMWGTMWSFHDICDVEYYFGEYLGGNHLQELADCGFRIFEYSDRDGNNETFIGIDAAGLDFYEAFWIPLYKKRGLKWHKDAA